MAPLITISGSKTGLSYPEGIALDSSNDIYVADNSANSVFLYQAGSHGNVAPLPTIGATVTTGLSCPQGIALDSSGKIYVVDDGPGGPGGDGPGSVFVYAALSNANAAPTATISGTNTGLTYPQGIAVDSSGKIYVADEGATSVFVYPAGSNGNVAPTATITGGETGLDTPEGIALDPNRNIYVADDGDDECLRWHRERVCLCGREHRQCRPHRHHQWPAVVLPNRASRWIPAATSMWRTRAPPACLSIRR